MNENFDVDPQVLKAKITAETARIHWLDLQKFYAAGSVVQVAANLDLIEVAYAFSQDLSAQVQHWLSQGSVCKVTDLQAEQWFSQKAELWAVVVSPWVLVQDKAASAVN